MLNPISKVVTYEAIFSFEKKQSRNFDLVKSNLFDEQSFKANSPSLEFAKEENS